MNNCLFYLCETTAASVATFTYYIWCQRFIHFFFRSGDSPIQTDGWRLCWSCFLVLCVSNIFIVLLWLASLIKKTTEFKYDKLTEMYRLYWYDLFDVVNEAHAWHSTSTPMKFCLNGKSMGFGCSYSTSLCIVYYNVYFHILTRSMHIKYTASLIDDEDCYVVAKSFVSNLSNNKIQINFIPVDLIAKWLRMMRS